jgi:predicted PurR-regulated permease PerM
MASDSRKSLHWGIQATVWGGLFGVLFLLRSFFLLVFLTFVFSYILNHTVEYLRRFVKPRTPRVVGASLLFLSIIIAVGMFVIPRVREQAVPFFNNYPKYMANLDNELVRLSDSYPLIDNLLPGIVELRQHSGDWSVRVSPSAKLIQDLFGNDEDRGSDAAKVKETIRALAEWSAKLLGIGSSFLLALLFSFLIILDLPRLAASVRELANTRIGFIYNEVAGSIYNFGETLGRALQAQLFVAILNTLLTAAALPLLGLGENTAFLSMIVFLGSFVPVAGVFMSSIPICLITLQDSGFQLMIAAIGLITVIHLVETYILNPRIYGAHLHMNPVLVLAILTIGGKLFGVWGLVLGVPICRYIFGTAIRYNHSEPGRTVTPVGAP